MKRVIIRSVRNDRIIKIWQIEIRISASAKKPKLFISGRTQNPTEKNQTEEEKMMRLIKKQSVGKNIRQQLGLYPGLSVSCDDICGRFCNERSLSFWGKFGACC